MAEHIWTVLCRRILFDSETRSTSLVDTVEVLVLNIADEGEYNHIAGIKKTEGILGGIYPAEFKIVSWWLRSDMEKRETATARLSVETPDGLTHALDNSEISIDLEVGASRRLHIKVESLFVADVGLHWIIVERKGKLRKGEFSWDPVARVPLQIEANLALAPSDPT